jgi:hypothetical protein
MLKGHDIFIDRIKKIGGKLSPKGKSIFPLIAWTPLYSKTRHIDPHFI